MPVSSEAEQRIGSASQKRLEHQRNRFGLTLLAFDEGEGGDWEKIGTIWMGTGGINNRTWTSRSRIQIRISA